MESSEQNSGDASRDAVELIGYLRKGDSDKFQLYKTRALNRWVEINSADVVEPLPTVVDDDRVLVNVRREAILVWCDRVPASNPKPICDRDAWPRK